MFEASGFTIDVMAEKAPDVLAKLRKAIESGQCEFMGAPYSHPIMANIPEEDGFWSCEFSQRAYERHLGTRIENVKYYRDYSRSFECNPSTSGSMGGSQYPA